MWVGETEEQAGSALQETICKTLANLPALQYEKTQHTNNQKTAGGGVLQVHSVACCELNLPCKYIHRFTLLTSQKSPVLAFFN